MTHNAAYVDMCNGLKQPGCAVCRIVNTSVLRYLDGLLYENVNDSGTRAKLRSAHGLCRDHARQAAALHDALGLSIIYHDILSNISDSLGHMLDGIHLPTTGLLRRDRNSLGSAVARRLVPHRPCPACAVRDDVTDTLLNTLVTNLTDSEMRAAFDASTGLCFVHLHRALALTSDMTAVRILIGKEQQVVEGLVTELAEFIRKHDYRRAGERMGSERDAWLRAIAIIVGSEDNSFKR